MSNLNDNLKNKKFLIPICYSISRLVDVLSISFLTDFLVRYSRSNGNIFFLPRVLVFYILNKSKMARSLILNTMTNGLFQ